MARETYSAVLEKTVDGYGVSFPLFPGCVSFGRTRAEAQENASDALELHIAGMRDDGDDIPHEAKVEDEETFTMHASGGTAGEYLWPIWVVVNVSDQNERVNVYLPKRLIAGVDRYAAGSGMNRSSVFGLAVQRYLRQEADGKRKPSA